MSAKPQFNIGTKWQPRLNDQLSNTNILQCSSFYSPAEFRNTKMCTLLHRYFRLPSEQKRTRCGDWLFC